MCGVSLSHHGRADPADDGRTDPAASPRARRAGLTRWRDPRLWVGVLLVLAGVVGGAKVLSAADDTTSVWAAAHDIHVGAEVTRQDLVRTDVHFTDRRTRAQYLPGQATIPPDARAVHDLAAGQLVGREVLDTSALHARQLPLAVPPQGMPAGLDVGDRVTVWAVPDPSSSQHRRKRPTRVLRDVAVVTVSESARAGLGGDRQVLVRLPRDTDVAAVLRALGGASVVLVRLGD